MASGGTWTAKTKKTSGEQGSAMRYRIVTESGSTYQLDTEAGIMLRVPSEGAAPLVEDNEPMYFVALARPPRVGQELAIFWLDGTRPKLRVTTPLTSVKREGFPHRCGNPDY